MEATTPTCGHSHCLLLKTTAFAKTCGRGKSLDHRPPSQRQLELLDGPRDGHAESSESEREGQISHDAACVCYLKIIVLIN